MTVFDPKPDEKFAVLFDEISNFFFFGGGGGRGGGGGGGGTCLLILRSQN